MDQLNVDRFTPKGFLWGPIELERAKTVSSGRNSNDHVLVVSTLAGHKVELRVTKAGRAVRISVNGELVHYEAGRVESEDGEGA